MKIKIYNKGKLISEGEPDVLVIEVNGIAIRVEEYEGNMYMRADDPADTIGTVPVNMDAFAVVGVAPMKRPRFE